MCSVTRVSSHCLSGPCLVFPSLALSSPWVKMTTIALDTEFKPTKMEEGSTLASSIFAIRNPSFPEYLCLYHLPEIGHVLIFWLVADEKREWNLQDSSKSRNLFSSEI